MSLDSFVGDGLNPSPYKEAVARAERAEQLLAEMAQWYMDWPEAHGSSYWLKRIRAVFSGIDAALAEGA